MSYPGAGRNHGHHQQVGGGGGMPQPNYGGGGYNQGPPQGGYNPGYGGPPPQQQQFGGGGGFPQPQYQQAPPPHQSYQQYAPPPNQGFPQPSYQQQQQQQQGYAPPPMHYAPPGAPPPQNIGPAQYQGGQFQMHMQPVRNQQMYSNCSGKRKALLVGINYTGTSNALRGCHNDVKNLAAFLMERYQFKKEDMVLLMDLPQGTAMEQPTRANITRAMQWLVRDAQPNDSLFFHYSGHGGQAEDLDGDEDDGYDETIYPLDFKTAGQMIDDEMHDILVRPLPQGCRLTAIFDSCHSGSALDLPYLYSTKGVLKEPKKVMLADAGSGALGALTSYARGDLGGVFKSITGVGKRLTKGNSAQQKTKTEKTSYADVIMWSGCKDSQTSADASEAGSATGAMSWAFKTALTKYPQQTYLQLLNTIRDELQGKYDQKPQLSCSHELDTSLLAIL